MADPSQLFLRAYTVQIGTLLIDGTKGTALDVEFDIKRGVKVTSGGSKPMPNTCDLKVWNLSVAHQKQLEQSTVPGAAKTVVPVVISAGYAGRASVVFSGELRAAHTVTDGPDAVTELTTGDGDDALTQRRLSVALGPGSNGTQGIKTILSALGVGPGNLQKGITLLQQNPLASQLFSKGCVMKGQAAVIMTELCRACGLEWSVQHGVLQMTAMGQPLDGQAILIDSTHGLIGSPTVDTTGVLSFDTEMLPDVAPGVKVAMSAKDVKGGYRITSVETKGASRGDEWGHSIEAVRY